MMNNSKNLNIYAYNILKAGQCRLDESYAFLVSTLLHLQSQLDFGNINSEDFAKELLEVINQSHAFKSIDRVCISINQPGSNRLGIISSYNNNKLKTNVMTANYHCFISPQSSIFRTQNSNIRIYSDINHVLNTYEGRPAQRSLRYLAEMGIKSGITIPLKINNQVGGFLFLNSCQPGNFENLKPEDYTVLCLIKMCASAALNKINHQIQGSDGQINDFLALNLQTTNRFSKDIFTNVLTKIIQMKLNRNINLKIDNQVTSPFLVALNPLAFIIGKAMEFAETRMDELKLTISLNNAGPQKRIEMILDKINIPSYHLLNLQNLKPISNCDVNASGDKLTLSFDFDSAPDFDYSI